MVGKYLDDLWPYDKELTWCKKPSLKIECDTIKLSDLLVRLNFFTSKSEFRRRMKDLKFDDVLLKEDILIDSQKPLLSDVRYGKKFLEIVVNTDASKYKPLKEDDV